MNDSPTRPRDGHATAEPQHPIDKGARERRRIWASRVKRGLIGLFVLAALAAVVMVWMPKPVPVDLARVAPRHLQVTIDEDGRTRVKDRYLVSAPMLANVARLALSPGDEVKPGDVLARLFPLDPQLLDARSRAQAEARVEAARAASKQAQATIARVRTALAVAQREAERQRELAKRGATPERALELSELDLRAAREELKSAEFGAKVAENELRMARAALLRLEPKPARRPANAASRSAERPLPLAPPPGTAGQAGEGEAADDEVFEVISPVAGRVLKVMRESEGVVQPGTPLVELGDPAALEIVVDVLTSDAVGVESGAPVRIERWGGPEALAAHVRLVEPSAFTRISALGVEEQRVNVIVDLDEPQTRWAALGDGYRVEARIILWEGEALSVPASAVFRHDGGHAVFAVEDGRAQRRAIEVGHQNPQLCEVQSGLREGDQVVLYPGDRVTDGVAVVQR